MLKFLAKIWPKRWVATAVVVATILYLTLVPKPLPDEAMLKIPGIDKIVHACMFGGLAFVGSLDCARRSGIFLRLNFGPLLFICFAAVLFGGAIELLQQAMGIGRGADWLDFGADAAGSVIAFFVVRGLLRGCPENIKTIS